MIEVDIAILGSGLSALKALSIAKSFSKKAIAIDPTYSDGGYLQVLDYATRLPKSPLFIGKDDAEFFKNLGIDILCLDVETIIIKENDYVAKTLGFAKIDVQKNWFVEWINSRKLCTSLDMFSKLKRFLGFRADEPIHMSSSVRKIDVEKKVIALTTGEIVRYRYLISTWPLNIMPKYLYPSGVSQKVKEYVDRLNLDYVSIYILSALLPSKDVQNLIKIYTHATKASRTHTVVAINIQDVKVLYTITSYTKTYPLLPGIHEKLLSEVKKHRIAVPTDIVKRYGINIVYGLINKINHNILEELAQTLVNIDINLFGRLALWSDRTVKEILEDKKIVQIIK